LEVDDGWRSSLYAPFMQGISGIPEKSQLLRMVRKTGVRSMFNSDTLPHSVHEFAIALFDEKMCAPSLVHSCAPPAHGSL
jgi:hypothetical protein